MALNCGRSVGELRRYAGLRMAPGFRMLYIHDKAALA